MTMQVIVDAKLHAEFKAECAIRQQKMREVVEQLIANWIKENSIFEGSENAEAPSLLSKDNNISNFQQATKESA